MLLSFEGAPFRLINMGKNKIYFIGFFVGTSLLLSGVTNSAWAFSSRKTISMIENSENSEKSGVDVEAPRAAQNLQPSQSNLSAEWSSGTRLRTEANESDACPGLPTKVVHAFEEALDFSESCPAAKLAPGKYIAVNNYTSFSDPRMYIFNTEGRCIDSVPISWGMGSDHTGRLEACSTENSKKTPPGFHITVPHRYGARYNESNSLGLAGLSGQNSLGERGILLHGVRVAGRSNTWGCTGVPFDQFASLKEMLGTGSLVYNYFGQEAQRNCSRDAGFAPPACEPEPLAYEGRSGSFRPSMLYKESKRKTKKRATRATQ